MAISWKAQLTKGWTFIHHSKLIFYKLLFDMWIVNKEDFWVKQELESLRDCYFYEEAAPVFIYVMEWRHLYNKLEITVGPPRGVT